MIPKRILGMITVRRGIAVQSFGYGRYLPLGAPEVLALNLDRWGADEIVVTAIDRSSAGEGPDLNMLAKISRRGISTPLGYGGGIRNADDARAVIGAGADRVVCDALLRDDPAAIWQIGEAIGVQGVIGSLPLSLKEGQLCWYDYRKRRSEPMSPALLGLIKGGALSELMISDWRNEGRPTGFDTGLLAAARLATPLILFGGISEPQLAAALLNEPDVAAVAIGNFLSYREHSIQTFRGAAAKQALRSVRYRAESDAVL